MGAAACGGKGSKGRAVVSGDRPIGAARCRQPYARGACQPPPPPRHISGGEHPPNSAVLGQTTGGTLPAPVWEECQGAEAAFVSSGTAAPL